MKMIKKTLILALLAISGIFYTACNQSATTQTNTKKDSLSTTEIAFVNLDTIEAKYDLYNVLSLQMTKKQQDLDKQLQSKMLSLQNRANKVQSQYEQHLITTMTYQQKMQKLQDEQNQIAKWQQQKASDLQDDLLNLQKRIRDSIVSAVNFYNKDKKYNLVLSDATEGTVLYVDNKIDISNEIVKILNNRAPVLDSLNKK